MRVSAESVPPRGSSAWRRAWDDLSDEIRRCTRCPLHHGRTQAVVYRGSLAPRIVFVGEAPGAAEDRVGLPFVGRSGRRLDLAVERLGLAPGDFGVLNLLKCRPPENRFDRAAARVCRPYLDRQLALLRPELLVTLGASALRAIDPGAPPISLAAGILRTDLDPPVVPWFHPAAALRSRRWSERWDHDVRGLATWLRTRAAQPV